MLSPLCTRGASLCPGKHNRPRQGRGTPLANILCPSKHNLPRQRRSASAVIFSLPEQTQPAKAKAECLRGHILFARANTTCQGKGGVPPLAYSLCPGKHNRPKQRKYGRPATGPRIAGWPLPVLARQHRSMEAQQRIPTGDRNGCGATPPQILYDNVIRLSLKWTFSTGTWMPSR